MSSRLMPARVFMLLINYPEEKTEPHVWIFTVHMLVFSDPLLR